VVLLLKNKPKAEATGIREEPCRTGHIIIRQRRSSGHNFFGLEERVGVSGVPKEVIPGTEEGAERREC
jgi:hypothetical protein